MEQQTKVIIGVVGGVVVLGVAAWALLRDDEAPAKKPAGGLGTGTPPRQPPPRVGSSPKPPRAPLTGTPTWNESLRPRAKTLAGIAATGYDWSTDFTWTNVAEVANAVAKELYPGSSIKWPKNEAESNAFLTQKKTGWQVWKQLFDIATRSTGFELDPVRG